MFEPFLGQINLIGKLWDNQTKLTELMSKGLHHQHGYSLPHVLILAGEQDERIPHWHSQSLWRIVQQATTIHGSNRTLHHHSHFHIFPNSRHSCHTHPEYYSVISKFIDKITLLKQTQS